MMLLLYLFYSKYFEREVHERHHLNQIFRFAVPSVALRQIIMENSNYELIKNRLQDSLNRNLSEKGWTLKTLSDKSGVPYETLKKLANAKIDNPSLQSVARVAQAFDCSVDSLLIDEPNLTQKLHSLPTRSLEFVEAITDFELALAVHEKTSGQCLLPVVVPTGAMEDGMIFDSLYTEYLDATPYLSKFGSHLMCALKITDDSFHPTYLKGDLLLIARERQPRYGTTSVFLHNNQLYIRKFIPGTPPRLDSLNNHGTPVYMDDQTAWTLFGCVLTVVRPVPQ